MLRAAQDSVVLSRRLLDLEMRLAGIVLHETFQYQLQLAALVGVLFRLYSLPFLQLGHTLETVGSIEPQHEPAAEQAPQASQAPSSGRRVQPERRVSAVVINFPERRVINR